MTRKTTPRIEKLPLKVGGGSKKPGTLPRRPKPDYGPTVQDRIGKVVRGVKSDLTRGTRTLTEYAQGAANRVKEGARKIKRHTG